MTPFLLHIARAGLYLSLFYAFYLLVMSRTTFFRLNRALLLAGSFLCLLLPCIKLRTVEVVTTAASVTMVSVAEGTDSLPLPSTFPWQTILFAIYVFGALATLMICVSSAWRLWRLISKGTATEFEDCRLILLEEETPSFSWGRNVVMSRKDLKENPAIFTHERMHVQCRHSLDLLLFIPLQLLFWWNPLMWIVRRELRLLHEYEADEGVVQNGIDATQYQLLLVRKAVGEQRFTLASGFQHAQLKNRIAMMLKPSSSGWIRWSYLALLPVLAAFMFACNPTKNTETAAAPAEDESPAPDAKDGHWMEAVAYESSDSTEEAAVVRKYNVKADSAPSKLLEKSPSFDGGRPGDFSQWVNSQLVYPQTAKADRVQGTVEVQFTVRTDGEVGNIKVLRSVRDDLDAEAVRVISASPKWEPGLNSDGVPVDVTFCFPITFKLK